MGEELPVDPEQIGEDWGILDRDETGSRHRTHLRITHAGGRRRGSEGCRGRHSADPIAGEAVASWRSNTSGNP